MSIFKHAWRMAALTGISAASLIVAAPAFANPPPPDGTNIGGCSDTLTNPNASACTGYYTGNILNGSSTDITNQQNAIAALPGTFTWNGDWNALATASNPYFVLDSDTNTANPGLTNGNELNFGQTLFGEVIIGAHYGNVPDPNATSGNVSVFWLFNFTTPTDFITLANTQGWSNAALYENGTPPGVPEPATWAMMLLGFGAAGIAIRRTRRRNVLATQLA
jgi:hypothetical protein